MNRFKMAAEKVFPAKKWKTIFLKECFIEIWFKIGGHQYIYNAEIKYGKSYGIAWSTQLSSTWIDSIQNIMDKAIWMGIGVLSRSYSK